MAAVLAACEGNEQAKTQVEDLFETFKQGNWQIVDAIQHIWAGERDEETLTAKIDYNSRAIVLAILSQLPAEPPPTQATEETQTTETSKATETPEAVADTPSQKKSLLQSVVTTLQGM